MIIYDSDQKERIFVDTFKGFWAYRDAIRLLVQRDISVRYRRSLFGVFWTLLNPLLTSLILWFVFINIFSSRLPTGTQFAPYVLSGVILVSFFSQGFNQSAESIALGAPILMKIYIPPQVFALSGALSNAVNFGFGLIALTLVSFLTGDGISILAPLSFLVVIAMLMYITGLGLIVSILYIRFNDTKNVFAVLVSFMMYLTPVFYPKEILSERMQLIISINPLTSFLDVFRSVFFNTGNANMFDWIYMLGFSSIIFLFGIKMFADSWPRTVVML
jgi:ABC-type polysaccharide/polyol phosphate export permease